MKTDPDKKGKTTSRARVRRLPKRAAYDAATIHGILDADFVAHVGFCSDGQPFMIPTLYGRSSEHLLRGRWDEVRAPNAQELKATTVLEFTIEEASAKIRTGGPVDEEADYALPVWAGVLPFSQVADAPVPDDRLGNVALPDYLTRNRP